MIAINILIAFTIFLAKVVEISLSSIKLIFMVKKEKVIASAIAFVECLVWAIVVSGVITNLKDNPLWIIAYCGGYALGYYTGSFIEEKLAMGTVFLQFIVPKSDEKIVTDKLKEMNCGITTMSGKGTQTAVTIIMTIVPRKNATRITDAVAEVSAKSVFAVVSDVTKTIGGSGLRK